jgi:glycolate oxidase iron-sulfur subunit
MIVLEGCVQPALSPNINTAAARVLDRLGISLIRASEAGCCGALALHLSIEDRARQAMRRNIDAWWPLLEAGAECIVMTASGCGVTVKEYGQVLADDSQYAEKARRVSSLTWDLSEILLREPMTASLAGRGVSVAVQTPCSLQHGQGINGSIEEILSRVGFQQATVENPHLCCGSAGSYSILQSSIAKRLRQDKLTALQAGGPNVIATANVGCQVHLAAKSTVPVRHWIELVDSAMQLND